MAQRITNLDIETTNEQVEAEWAQLFAIRNRLLEISDWTQLPDVSLSTDSKKQWKLWRQKLRKVNRNTFVALSQATDVLNVLKQEQPRNNEINFDEQYPDIEETKEKIVEKITIKEQPIIIKETINESTFTGLIKATLEKDAYEFKQYLLSFLNISNTNIFYDNDALQDAKYKALKFLAEQQTYSLNLRLVELPDNRVLQQRAEEAIEYLTDKTPELSNYPLMTLYIQYYPMTEKECALSFLRQKKWYNQLLLDSDKFTLYNTKAINDAEDINALKLIIEKIKNGY